MENKLDDLIKQAEENLKHVDWKDPKTSLMDKMKAYSHLNNLFLMKINNLLEKEKKK